MPGFLADDFLSRPGLRQDAGQVAHRAGRNKETGFAAENSSGAFLKLVERGVFNEDVISDFGFSHRTAHFRRWFGYGIASEVDNSVGHNNSSVTPLASSHPLEVSLRNLPSN